MKGNVIFVNEPSLHEVEFSLDDDNKESINTAIAFFGQVLLWLVIIKIEK